MRPDPHRDAAGEGRAPLIRPGDPSVPVTVQQRVASSPERAFDVIVPIDLPSIFRPWGPLPGVERVSDQSGAWDAVGRRRTPVLTDGSTAEEQLVEVARPHSFAYELTGFTGSLRLLVRGVRGE